MSTWDWIVMLGTLFFIVAYGTWKTRGSRNIEGFLKGDNSMKWWTIGLSVMATQASAITFLSTPGQAYTDGMRFVQFYFGLPIAMVIISAVFIPLYYRLKVYTAYEFLESRFDLKTRLLTAGLFLLQRGLAAGITIYAPAIILSQLLGWSLNFTILFIGLLVIIYTASGGTKAVSQTHKQQMAVIFTGLFIAFGMLVWYLSTHLSFFEGLEVAGKMGKLNVINLEFDPSDRYNIWSGIIGGLFLQLSYFGTDQSQVQRYLAGTSVKESRLGLMFNGLLKIPMQFFILLLGVMVFLFYQYTEPPLTFNDVNREKVVNSEKAGEYKALEEQHHRLFEEKQATIGEMEAALSAGNEARANALSERVKEQLARQTELREATKTLIKRVDADAETEDDDHIFVTFVMNYLPVGVVGLLLAVIFSAAMSSTSAELNSLASTATVDVYKRNFSREGSEKHHLLASRWFTLLFGVLAILFASLASLFENLIEAVNILGSLFYGTILGIFLVAFFIKYIRGHAVFIAALLAQAIIITLYYLGEANIYEIGYLWYNLLGPALVVVFGLLLEGMLRKGE